MSSTVYYRLVGDTNPTGWERTGYLDAIEALRANICILVTPATLSDKPLGVDETGHGVLVQMIHNNVFEITAPDATRLDVVHHSAAEALSEAAFFLMPLENRLKSFGEGLREAQTNREAEGDSLGAANLAKFAHDVERLLAHYKYEQVKRGDRSADLPPTGQERHLSTR